MKSIICLLVIAGAFAQTAEDLPNIPNDGSCVIGQSYRDGCYTCSCFAEKALMCKKSSECVEKAPESASLLFQEVHICGVGEIRNGSLGECSKCTCVKDETTNKNTWQCDDDNCQTNRTKRAPGTFQDLKTTPCAANDSFKLDCNTCYCNMDKSGYHCTEDICPPVAEALVRPGTPLYKRVSTEAPGVDSSSPPQAAEANCTSSSAPQVSEQKATEEGASSLR